MKNPRLAVAIFTGLLLFLAIAVENQSYKLAIAQTSESILIKYDGTIKGTNKIQRNENIYTLTGNISGNIQVRKGNIVIDGAGFTLNGNNDTGIDISNGVVPHPSDLEIWNVTVKNLRITNCRWGIHCGSGGNHTFYGNYISNDFVTQNGTGNFSWDNLGILFWLSSGNNITHCTIGGSPAIYMHLGSSNNIVTENNIVFGFHLAISGNETFDRNYWSDYLERYPNASEVDTSGIWNMPYAFLDNHPLVNSLSIPNFSSTLPSVQSNQNPVDIPVVLLAVSIIAAVIAIGLLVYQKKRKR